MEKLKQSPWEKLKQEKIMPIEQECLDRVFTYLSKCTAPKSRKFIFLKLTTISVASQGKNH